MSTTITNTEWAGRMTDALAGCDILGNAAIFSRQKTAFLCSRKAPAAAILAVCKWAEIAAAKGECVMSGFHTTLERDARKILLAGDSPLVWVCARGIVRNPPAEIRTAINNGRLLVASPFPADIRRPTKKLAHLRNLFILQNAARAVIGHAAKDGALAAALARFPAPAVYL